MAARWKIVCAFITLWYYCSADTFPVPLLMWSSKSLDVDDQILAGHTFNYKDVQDRYLDKLNGQSDTICVFVQDELSIDDFAAYQSGNLKHLRQVLESSATSIVLPSARLHSHSEQGVTNRLVKYFEKNSEGKVLSLTASDAPDFPSKIKTLKSDGPNIIIVHLPKSTDENDLSERNLVASDEVIGKLTDELSKYFPDYIGLLTAEMPRQDIMTGMEEVFDASTPHVRLRRAVQFRRAVQLDNKKIPCYQTGILVISDVMLSIGNISLVGSNKYDKDSFENGTNLIINNTVVKNGSEYSKMLSFSLSGVFINDSDITISMSFNRTSFRWKCVTIKINGTLSKSKIDASYDCSYRINDIPMDKSYSCQVTSNFTGSDNSSVVFQGLQVQAFGVEHKRFLNAYDCIGFFTAPIWMGLISTGVLIAILYGGVLSLLSIQSMDRFDNPKDPTIVIQNE